jgi:hypothetical protein
VPRLCKGKIKNGSCLYDVPNSLGPGDDMECGVYDMGSLSKYVYRVNFENSTLTRVLHEMSHIIGLNTDYVF